MAEEFTPRKISELPVNSSPSTSATLVGVDNGETVQIPVAEFAVAEHEHSEYAKTTDIPPAYSHPETHPASMITGLSKVATSGSYNDLTDKPTIPSGGGSGSSSGGGIITVDALPTEGVVDTIYKVYEIDEMFLITAYDGGEPMLEANYTEIVDELPEIGEPCMDFTNESMYCYYLRTDGKFYMYFTEEIVSALGGGTVGWNNLEAMGMPAITIIYSLEELDDSKVENGECTYAFAKKKPHLYIYEGGWVEIPIGFRIVHNPKLETITFIES